MSASCDMSPLTWRSHVSTWSSRSTFWRAALAEVEVTFCIVQSIVILHTVGCDCGVWMVAHICVSGDSGTFCDNRRNTVFCLGRVHYPWCDCGFTNMCGSVDQLSRGLLGVLVFGPWGYLNGITHGR